MNMTQQSLPSKLYRQICCCALFFAAASGSFNGYYGKWHFRETGVAYASSSAINGQFGFTDILDGTATRPFVYRQLLPSVANWLNKTTPDKDKAWLYNLVSNRERETAIITGSPLAQNPLYFFRYYAVYFLTFLFAWLSVFAMYLVCKALVFPPLTCVFAPVTMILAMPYFMSVGGYFYDYPELAFLALAVWMCLRLDWWWLLPLIAVATWNKESFFLVTITLYPILRSRYSRIAASIATWSLLVTSGLVYCALRWHFQNNPGGTVLERFTSQVLFLAHPMNLVTFESTYGVIAFRAFSVVPLALIAWTVWRGWNQLPEAIRKHGKIAAAINIPLFLLFCQPAEIRDLSMLYVVFMLLLAVTLAEVEGAGRGKRTRDS